MTRSVAWPYNSPTWRKLRPAIFARDGGLCQIRGDGCEVKATEVDHIVPHLAGGAVFDPENLRASCRHCNRSRARRRTGTHVKPSREWV